MEVLLEQQIAHAGTLAAPLTQYRFAREASPPRQWRFDLAWPDVKVAVEIQGGIFMQGKHSRGVGQERDAEKLSAAAILGWRVLVVTDRFIKSGQALDWVMRALEVTTTCPTTR